MDKCSSKNVSFSGSGFSALNRRLEQKLEILKDTLTRKDAWIYVAWDSDSSLDNFVQRGCYFIDGTRRGQGGGFPDTGANDEGDFSAILMVVDSTPVGNKRDEGVSGQFLMLSDNSTQRTRVYTRTNIYTAEKNSWGAWNELGENISMESKLQKLEQTVFPLEVTLSVSPSSAKEYTGAEEDFTISWTVKIAGEAVTPSSVKLLVGGVEADVSDGASSTTAKVVNDADVKLVVEADGRTATKTTKLNFAYPAYTGIVANHFIVNEANVTSLKKMPLVDGKGRTYTYDKALDKQKIVYAYAKSYGTLTGIIEGGSNNLINNYTRSEITINGIDYYVYITTNYFSTEQAPTYQYK